EHRLDVLFELAEQHFDPARQLRAVDDGADLNQRHDQRRKGNHAEEDDAPGVHTFSFAAWERAWAKASLPFWNASLLRSTPFFRPPRPLPLPSPRAPRSSRRVSAPVGGAQRSAAAAPAMAPTMKATSTVPA